MPQKRSAIQPRIMLQIAQPENVEPWFAAAAQAGVTDFDLIGISYYGYQWSKDDLAQTGEVIRNLRAYLSRQGCDAGGDRLSLGQRSARRT